MKLNTVLSLFDWISCWKVALERAWIEVEKYFTSEIKTDAITCSTTNFPNFIRFWDIKDWKSWDIKEPIDLIMWWFPCKSFSVAGKMQGFADERGQLFFYMMQVLKHFKPKYFFAENVKMTPANLDIINKCVMLGWLTREDEEWGDWEVQGKIINKNNKDLTTTIKNIKTWEIKSFAPTLINSSLVSAQLRKRFYWLWVRQDDWSYLPIIISQPEDKNINLSSILSSGYTDREKARAILESESRPLKSKDKLWRRYKKMWFVNIIFEKPEDEALIKEWDKNIGNYTNKNYELLFFDKNNPPLVKESHQIFTDNIRIFKQEELEKLQTMPEWFTKMLTRNQAAWVIWDAWTIDIIAHIFKHIKEYEQRQITQ